MLKYYTKWTLERKNKSG